MAKFMLMNLGGGPRYKGPRAEVDQADGRGGGPRAEVVSRGPRSIRPRAEVVGRGQKVMSIVLNQITLLLFANQNIVSYCLCHGNVTDDLEKRLTKSFNLL